MTLLNSTKRLQKLLRGRKSVSIRKSGAKTGITKTAFVKSLLSDDEFLRKNHEIMSNTDNDAQALAQLSPHIAEKAKGKVVFKPMAKSSMTIKPVKGAPKMPNPKFGKTPEKPTSKGSSRTTSVPKFLDDVNAWLVSKYFSGDWIETDGFLSHRQPPFKFSKDPEERKIQEDIINKTKKEWDTGKYTKLLTSGVGKGAEGAGVETAAVLIQIAAIATLTALGMDELAQKMQGNPKLKEARRQQKLFDNVYNDMNIKNNLKKVADRYQITQTTEQGVEITEGEIRHFNPKADASYIQAIQGAFESTRKQEYQDLLDSGMSSEKAWDEAGKRTRKDLLERLRDRWQPKPKPKPKTVVQPPQTTMPVQTENPSDFTFTGTPGGIPVPRLPTPTITIPDFNSKVNTSKGGKQRFKERTIPAGGGGGGGGGSETIKPTKDKTKPKTKPKTKDPKPIPKPKKPKKPKPDEKTDDDETESETEESDSEPSVDSEDEEESKENPSLKTKTEGVSWLRPYFEIGGQAVLRLTEKERLDEIEDWDLFDLVANAVNLTDDNPLYQHNKRQYAFRMQKTYPNPRVRKIKRKPRNLQVRKKMIDPYARGKFQNAFNYHQSLGSQDRRYLSDYKDEQDRSYQNTEVPDMKVNRKRISLFSSLKQPF